MADVSISPHRGASVLMHLRASIDVLERSLSSFNDDRVERAVDLIVAKLGNGRPLLVCGNDGSAADAQHIASTLR